MKRLILALSAVLCAVLASGARSGPIEEVAQIAAPRLQALQEGDLAAYVAAFADNATFHSALAPYRIDGKEAIRAYLAHLFEVYPKRRVLSRQPSMRAFNDDLVMQNAYSVLYLTDQQGQVTKTAVQSSLTWAKLAGRWQIVDQHNSRLQMGP